MDVKSILQHLELEGFCIVKNVIPEDKVEAVRDSVITVVDQESKKMADKMATIRGKGHRIGGEGIDNVPQLITHTQTFAPYIADERVLGTAEAMFGPYVKTDSSIDPATLGDIGTQTGHSIKRSLTTCQRHIQMPHSTCQVFGC